jgi:hypothetical protein
MTASTERPGLFITMAVLVVMIALMPLLSALPAIHLPDVKQTITAYPEDTTLEMDISTSLHADRRHGIEASMARTCNPANYEHKFYNPHTKRTAYICTVSGIFGIHILDELGEEVTSFLKNKMKNFDQVLCYMKNAGYELLQ